MKLHIPELSAEPITIVWKKLDGMMIPPISGAVPAMVDDNKTFAQSPAAVMVVSAWNGCQSYIKTPGNTTRHTTDQEHELVSRAYNSQA